MRLFVDTSGWYALADRSDRHHPTARAALERRRPEDEWVTTDHVLVESWLLIRSRLGYDASLKLWDAIAQGLALVAGLSSADLVRARGIARDWRDQQLSLVDCTSFAFLERTGIEHVLAFDAHFGVIRLGPQRARPLRLVTDTERS
jgi:predicted nucleic acid-binding protein